jgi:hypothetical protein
MAIAPTPITVMWSSIPYRFDFFRPNDRSISVRIL